MQRQLGMDDDNTNQLEDQARESMSEAPNTIEPVFKNSEVNEQELNDPVAKETGSSASYTKSLTAEQLGEIEEIPPGGQEEITAAEKA